MDVVALYNMALGKAGTRTTVSSASEGSNESNSCNAFYATVRKSALRAVEWNFARKQKLLTQLKSSADVPNTVPAPWAYEYLYPVDCLNMRYILPKVLASDIGGVPIDSSGALAVPDVVVGVVIPYIIGVDEDSQGNNTKVILTNQYQAEAIYTMDMEDPNFFDELFVEALTSALAVKIGRNLTADKDLIKDLKAETMAYMREAETENGNETPRIQDSLPDWMRVRGVASDFLGPSMGFTNFDAIFGVA